MMNTIVKEKQVSFKEAEQKVFAYVCGVGREILRIMLEAYDDELSEKRDRKVYRDKGKRRTCIKTVLGEVLYSRRVYQTETGDGRRTFVYLLDEAMGMEKIGLLSTNLAEKIAYTVTESPYRVTADIISSTCGQSISAGGVWNMVQRIGERVRAEEGYAVKQMEAGQTEGEALLPVLFEEMDGVWLSMQGECHKRAAKQEMKVFTMYEGWDREKEKAGRSTLSGKKMLAGMEKGAAFHEKREAFIRQRYDADEIGLRVLNGDGGSWIKETYDPEAIFQLDRYHIYQEILRKVKDKKAQKAIRALLEAEKPEEMLEYILVYAGSIESPDEKDTGSQKARELYQYLHNNKEGLLPYDRRGLRLPAPPEGVLYKGMGVQENQNCTAITMRMKHRRMRWSVSGADNMAKALYRKENGELAQTIGRCADSCIFTLRMQEIAETLSAAKAPKKDGKGNSYAAISMHHMPLLDAVRTASRKALLSALCEGGVLS